MLKEGTPRSVSGTSSRSWEVSLQGVRALLGVSSWCPIHPLEGRRSRYSNISRALVALHHVAPFQNVKQWSWDDSEANPVTHIGVHGPDGSAHAPQSENQGCDCCLRCLLYNSILCLDVRNGGVPWGLFRKVLGAPDCRSEAQVTVVSVTLHHA